MKVILIKMIKFIICMLPKRRIILFESNPDFSCNTYPVFLEISQRRYFKKYKFIWIVSDGASNKKNVILKNPKNYFQKLKSIYYKNVADCVISCNMLIPKERKGQLAVFLSHGSKTKKTKGICEIGNSVDYVLCQAHFFDDVIKYEYDLKQSQLVYLGYPRCDYLYNKHKNIHRAIGINENSNYIIWLPTFRTNAAFAEYDTVSDYDKIGMPIIYSVEELIALNRLLCDNDIYIVFKPHPAQEISTLKAITLSNILIIDDKWIKDRGLQLYEVISESSALITDYSSVFFDYLLLDRPIATTTDDLDKWKEKRGFAFDLEAMYDSATIRVPDYKTLENFILSIKNGIDLKRADRNRICELTNIYQDGDSAKRVADFIQKKLSEK